MKVIKAVKQNLEERNKCFGCVARSVSCYEVREMMEEAGLPDCGEGYIYVSCEGKNENIK